MKSNVGKLIYEAIQCGYAPGELRMVVEYSERRGTGWEASLYSREDEIASAFSTAPDEAIAGLATQLRPKGH